MDAPRFTTALMPYYLPPADGSRAYKNINDRDDKNYIRHNVACAVEDISARRGDFLLDEAGVQFFDHATQCTDWTDAGIAREYYPEMAAWIKAQTGASEVHLFDHTVRRHRPDDATEGPDRRQPVSNVHVDQTPASARARVFRHILPHARAAALVQGRFALLNAWRPLRHAAHDWPLGFVDARSAVGARDLFAMTLKFPGGPGETFAVMHHAAHRWVYRRGMRPDEVALFKCYDSGEGVCSFNAHTGFADPLTPPNAPLRESIEIRALVFWAAEGEGVAGASR